MRSKEHFYNGPPRVGTLKTSTAYQATAEDCKIMEVIIIVVIITCLPASSPSVLPSATEYVSQMWSLTLLHPWGLKTISVECVAQGEPMSILAHGSRRRGAGTATSQYLLSTEKSNFQKTRVKPVHEEKAVVS